MRARLSNLVWWSVTSVVALLLAVGSLYWLGELHRARDADRRAVAVALCERAVEAREDGRAMWLYLFDLLGGGPLVPEVRAELDRRLPRLECIDNIPAPKETP